ncbi:hypothetical protein BB560_002741 [Smittium megazygosporum]|uniref:RNA polymerase II assembly factor Rtp1 C-terminal domain-containing protein n=1 Tax=Smittium megazygosporum TaxID=133381 RepID=A0A2T9ZE22_9FUNG|nr:hypothetical protein BB560_002741 [Smittium megazygosporum]
MEEDLAIALKVIYKNVEELKQYLFRITLAQTEFIDKKVKKYSEIPKNQKIAVTKIISKRKVEEVELKKEIFSHTPAFKDELNLQFNSDDDANIPTQNIKLDSPLVSTVLSEVENVDDLCEVLFDNILFLQRLLSTIIQTKTQSPDQNQLELLGLRDKQNINQVIDFVIVFAVVPKLHKSTTLQIDKRLEFSKLDKLGFKSHVFKRFNEITSRIYGQDSDSDKQKLISLFNWTEKLGDLVTQPFYGLNDASSLTRSRALIDIVSAFLQTAYSPLSSKIDDPHFDKEKIIYLRKLFTKIFNNTANHQILLESFFALKNIAGINLKWFSILVSRFLTRLILFENGLARLFSFILTSEATDTNLSAPKLESIYKLVSNIPSNINPNEYYTNIFSQISKILSTPVLPRSDAKTECDVNKNSGGLNQPGILDTQKQQDKITPLICRICVYILTRLYAEKFDILEKTSVPIIFGPFLKWDSKKEYLLNSNLSFELSSTTENVPTLEQLLTNVESQKTLNSKTTSKPLITVIGESTSDSEKLDTTKSLDSDKTASKVLHALSKYIQVYYNNEQGRMSEIQPVFISSAELIKIKNRLANIYIYETCVGKPLSAYLFKRMFFQIMFWYQFLLVAVNNIQDSDLFKREDGFKTLQEGKTKGFLDLIKANLQDLETFIVKSCDSHDISDLSTLFKKILLEDRLLDVFQLENDSKANMYPLFALGEDGEINMVYPLEFPQSLLVDSIDSKISHESNSEFESLKAENQTSDFVIDLAQRFQSKFQVYSLHSLIQKNESAKNFKELVSLIFVNCLNEYTLLHNKISNFTSTSAPRSNPKIQDLSEATEFKSQETQSELFDISVLVRKYSFLSQTLLDFIYVFGPAVLAKKSHVLAFVDNVLKTVMENPPVKLTNDNLDNLNDSIYSRIGKESPIGDGAKYNIALNILIVFYSSNFGLESEETVENKRDSKDDEAASHLLAAITKKLASLKTQWNGYPMITQLIDQIFEFSEFENPVDSLFDSMSIEEESTDTRNVPNAQSLYISALTDLQSPLVPIQAYGLTKLLNLVTDQRLSDSEPLSESQIDNAIETIIELIKHEDSFIYLKAIQALGKIASIPNQADRMITILVEKYNDKASEIDFRIRISEVFVGIVSTFGDLMIRFTDKIIPTMVRTIDYRVSEDPVLIQSALSIISIFAEINAFVLQYYLMDITEYCKHICLTPNYEQHIKRASLVCLISIVRGYDKSRSSLNSIDPSILKTIYSTLKSLSSSNPVLGMKNDELLEHNARMGLQEFNDMMKQIVLNQ